MLPGEIKNYIENELRLGIRSATHLGGGCINDCAKLETSKGPLFVKWNNRVQYPGMLECEAKGLQLLRQTKTVNVPEVVHCGATESYQILALEFVKEGARHKADWRKFGGELAALHRTSQEAFGLDHDNFIGSLQQRNVRTADWIDFFSVHRILYQLELPQAKSLIDHRIRGMFSMLFERLPLLLPNEKPALVHGDLWGGNLMVTENSDCVVIDPALYFGNREVDLAMTQLFGGFDGSFFVEAYNEFFPLREGYIERFDIYNLYPLLVHVNLFGSTYVPQVVSSLKRFV